MIRLIALFALLLGTGTAFAESIVSRLAVTPPRPPVLVTTLDFTSALPGTLTYTRSGSMWTYDSAGVLTTYGINSAPIPSYNNAGTQNSGIALMPARTNFCLNSLTPAAQTVTGMTGTYVFSIGPHDSGSVTLSGGASGVVTAGNPIGVSGLSSASVTVTPSGTVSYLGCEKQSGSAVTNFTATPPVVTAGAAASRLAETLTGTTAGLGISPTVGTMIVSGEIQAANSSNQYIVSLDDGTTDNYLSLMYAPATSRLQAQYTSGGAIVATAGITTSTFPLRFIAAISYSPNGITVALNGNTASASASLSTSSYTTFRVGNSATSALSCVCFISQIDLYDAPMTVSQLNTMTLGGTANFSRDLSFLIGLGQSDEWGSYASPTTGNYSSATWQNAALGGTYLWKLNWSIGVSGFAGINPLVAYSNFTDISPAYYYELPPGFSGTSICSGTYETVDYSCGQSAMFAMGAQLRTEGSGENYLLIGGSAPGHKCDELGPTSAGAATPYNYTLTEIQRAAAQNRASGYTPTIRGIVVNHGQTDAAEGTSYGDFLSCWTSLISQTVANYKSATLQTVDPIFFFTGINTDASGVATQGFPMQQAFYDMTLGGSPISNTRMCAPAYLFPLNPDHGPHYTAVGQDMQGEYRAQCYYEEFYGAGNWKPLYPTSIGASGTTVTVDLNVPSGALTVDSSGLPQGGAPFLGFWYVDDSNNIITGVSIAGSVATLTLSGTTNPSGRKLRVAYNGPVIAHDTLLPTIASGGSGGTDGACEVTVQIDTSHVADTFTAPYGYFQAKYNVTISGGAVTAINSIASYGGYPNGDQGGLASAAGTYSAVPIIGCGLSGATFNSVRLRQGFASNSYAGAWANLRDSWPGTFASGRSRYNWIIPFDISF